MLTYAYACHIGAHTHTHFEFHDITLDQCVEDQWDIFALGLAVDITAFFLKLSYYFI